MLNEQNIKILNFIAKKHKVTHEEIKQFLGDANRAEQCIVELKKYDFIAGTYKQFNPVIGQETFFYLPPYEITPKGLAYLEKVNSDKKQYKSESWHRWINTIIGLLALLHSIIDSIF